MKKLLILIILLFLIVCILIFNLINSNEKIKTNLILNNKIAEISRLNTDLLIFTKSHSQYKNYDKVENTIFSLNNIYDDLANSKKYKKIKDNELYKKLLVLKQTIDNQIKIIQKQKSYDAIYNNSMKNIQKLKSTMNTKFYDYIYNIALTLDFEKNVYDEELKNELKKLEIYSFEDSMFVKHLNIVFEYYQKKHDLLHKVEALNVQDELKKLIIEFEQYSKDVLKNINTSIIVLFIILLILISILSFYTIKVLKIKLELDKMKKALDISDNTIIVTDINHKIKYVNSGFERNTGYKRSEVLGKKPSMLSSGKLNDSFYEKIHETIHSGKEWNGELINKNKNGDIVYEKSTITPIKDENGKIIEFLAIKLDITRDKEYQDIFLQQAKMASMGELLENISHQWRQPLSIISSISSSELFNLELNKETHQMDKKSIEISFRKIFDTTQNLSKTIDDLKEFFNKEDEVISFNVKDTFSKTLHLFNMKLEMNKIDISITSEDIILSGKENELIQALINILNNSLDSFIIRNIEKKYIEIKTEVKNSFLIINIKDNAGGIDKEILHRIFDLYFTTKHKYMGTGIGLYMTYQIITKIFKGTISIENTKIRVDNQLQKGITAKIVIPL